MFFKKLFYKINLHRYSQLDYIKYTFKVYISNDCIDYEYPYYTTYDECDIVKNIFHNGLKIDNWFINKTQIESIKLVDTKIERVYIIEKEWYKELTLEEIKVFNEKYNKCVEFAH